MKPLATFLFCVIFFTACTTPKMALDKQFWQHQNGYAVTGKRGLFSKEKMQFGPFYTTAVKRSWVKGSSAGFGIGSIINESYANIISIEYIHKKQTVHFKLSNGQWQSESYCVTKFNTKDLTIGKNPSSLLNIGIDAIQLMHKHPDHKYYVQIYLHAGEKPWELLFDNTQSALSPGSYKGYLVLDDAHYYSIVPIRHMENKQGESAPILFGYIGLEIRNKDNQPVAAISKLQKGVVYLQPLGDTEKMLLANACTALLLQDMIDN